MLGTSPTVAQKLKKAGRPYGQTAGHTFGDAPGWWYPYLWSWGGKEVEAEHDSLAVVSLLSLESVKFAVPLWKETMDERGLAWDDTNNNRAFLSGTISATNNGASIYIEAKKKPDVYKTEKGKPMKDDILHAGIPACSGAQFNLPGPFTNLLMVYSKNQRRRNNSCAGSHRRKFTTSGSSRSRVTPLGRLRCGKIIRCGMSIPILAPFKQIPVTGRLAAMPDPPTRTPPRCGPSFIITDMYAKAIQGMPTRSSRRTKRWLTHRYGEVCCPDATMEGCSRVDCYSTAHASP